MLTLGVDTSNYATSLAVVDTSRREVVCMLKQFLPVKPGEAGLRQSDALFHHTAALPQLLQKAARLAALQQVEAVGVSERPRPVEGSYMPCFLAGVAFAKAFAAGRGCPVRGVSHQRGHLAAALFGAAWQPAPQQAYLFFHASGGTTELLLCHGSHIEARLGGSLDLYAGQAVDRLGVRLGHAFPAGQAVSALAQQCREPVDPKISVEGMDCHLSGLQNQCEALLEKACPPAYAAKYCLTAIAKTTLAMVKNARAECGALPVLLAGGVMCSGTIRAFFEAADPTARFAPPEYSADNAVGVALLAAEGANDG